jgi:hypothetical protein
MNQPKPTTEKHLSKKAQKQFIAHLLDLSGLPKTKAFVIDRDGKLIIRLSKNEHEKTN